MKEELSSLGAAIIFGFFLLGQCTFVAATEIKSGLNDVASAIRSKP